MEDMPASHPLRWHLCQYLVDRMVESNLEKEISKITDFVRTTVKRFGKINVDITTEN